MMTTPAFNYSHGIRGNVLIQDLSDWTGELDGFDQVQHEFLEEATKTEITATVTTLDGDILTERSRHHLVMEWSETASEVDIDRIAFVRTSGEALAKPADVDVPQEVETFVSLGSAIEWAQE